MIGAMAAFDDWSQVYEQLVDWPKRLAREAPFYRRWFERVGAHRVVDQACGVGYHAAMFHDWGLAVAGADVSPQMIAAARRTHPPSETLTWHVRSFDQPIPPPPFDVAVCIGNSLALAIDPAMVAAAIQQLLAGVRAGGAVVIQVLNLWRLPDGPCVWQKRVGMRLQEKDCWVLKGVHRCGGQGYVNLVVVPREEPEVLRSESVPFLGLDEGFLQRCATQQGATTIELFGGYDEQPYERATSNDLIMVLRK
jgi:SAM-dependent methyltransferase